MPVATVESADDARVRRRVTDALQFVQQKFILVQAFMQTGFATNDNNALEDARKVLDDIFLQLDSIHVHRPPAVGGSAGVLPYFGQEARRLYMAAAEAFLQQLNTGN